MLIKGVSGKDDVQCAQTRKLNLPAMRETPVKIAAQDIGGQNSTPPISLVYYRRVIASRRIGFVG